MVRREYKNRVKKNVNASMMRVLAPTTLATPKFSSMMDRPRTGRYVPNVMKK